MFAGANNQRKRTRLIIDTEKIELQNSLFKILLHSESDWCWRRMMRRREIVSERHY